MNDLLPVVFAVVLIVLAIVLALVGFQMVIVLVELKRTLQKVNSALDQAENKINSLVAPLQNLGGLATGLQAGMHVFEAFVGWLNQKKEEKKKA
ncbi:MAG: hypothetical protein ACOZAN_01840 [Patescibacteria group bacterium]